MNPRRVRAERDREPAVAPPSPSPAQVAAALHGASVAVVVAMCFALRLRHAGSTDPTLDGDEAVTGIMALRILDGEAYAFFAGQTYMGALEQYAQAVAFLLLPATSLNLRLVPILFATAACLVLYLVAVRVLGSRWLGLFAAAIFAVGPAFNIARISTSHGAYASSQLIAIMALLIAFSFPDARRPRLAAAAFGTLAGIGIWQNLQTLYLLVPAAIWIVAQVRPRRAVFAAGGAGLVVGLLPLLAWIARWGELPGLPPHPPSTVFERAENLFGPVLVAFLGLAGPGGHALYPWLPAALIAAVLIGVLAIALWRRRGPIVSLLRLAPGDPAPLDVILLAFAIVPPIYLASQFAWYAGQPRYLTTLYVALPIALAALLPRRPTLGVPVAAVLVAFVALAAQTDLDRGGPTSPPERDVRAAADVLRAEGSPLVYADYWLAFVLQFLSGDDIPVWPFTGPRFARPPEHLFARRPTYAAVADGAPSAGFSERMRRAVVEGALRAAGARYRTITAGDVVLFVDVEPPVDPDAVGLGG